jgi:hypothetical protein
LASTNFGSPSSTIYEFIMTFDSIPIGMIVGQIISLRNVGVLGGFSLYVNLLIVFMSMYVVAHSPPDFEAADAANDTLGTGPVIVKAFNSGQLVEQVGGMFKYVVLLLELFYSA